MNSIWDITLREWLTFMCHGYIDSSGHFRQVKEKALSFTEPHRLDSSDISLLRECLETIKEEGVTAPDNLVAQYGPFSIYPALPTAKALMRSRANYGLESETITFFAKHSAPFSEGAYEGLHNAKSRSVDHMYIVEVDVLDSTDTESSWAEAKLRFLIDGINRLTLVQERLGNMYGRPEKLKHFVELV